MRTLIEIKTLLTASGELLTKVMASTAVVYPEGRINHALIEHSTRYYVAVSLLISDGLSVNQARYRSEALESLVIIGKMLKTSGLNSNAKLQRLWRSSEPMIRLLKEKVLSC